MASVIQTKSNTTQNIRTINQSHDWIKKFEHCFYHPEIDNNSGIAEKFENILRFRLLWTFSTLPIFTFDEMMKERLPNSSKFKYTTEVPEDGILYRIISRSANGNYYHAVPLHSIFGAEPCSHLRNIAICAASRDISFPNEKFTSFTFLRPGFIISVKCMARCTEFNNAQNDLNKDFKTNLPTTVALEYEIVHRDMPFWTRLLVFKVGRTLRAIAGEHHFLASPYAIIRCSTLRNNKLLVNVFDEMAEGDFGVIDACISRPIDGIQRFPRYFRNNMTYDLDKEFINESNNCRIKSVRFPNFEPAIMDISSKFMTSEEYLDGLRTSFDFDHIIDNIKFINCSLKVARIRDCNLPGYNQIVSNGIPNNIKEFSQNSVSFTIELSPVSDGNTFPTDVHLMVFGEKETVPCNVRTVSPGTNQESILLKVIAKSEDIEGFLMFLKEHESREEPIYCRQEACSKYAPSKFRYGWAYNRETVSGRKTPAHHAQFLLEQLFFNENQQGLEYRPTPNQFEIMAEESREIFNIQPTPDQLRTMIAAEKIENLLVIDTPAGGGKTTSIAFCAAMFARKTQSEIIAVLTSSNSKIIETIESVVRTDAAENLRIMNITSSEASQTNYDSNDVLKSVIIDVVEKANRLQFPPRTPNNQFMLIAAYGYANTVLKIYAGLVPSEYLDVNHQGNRGSDLPENWTPIKTLFTVGFFFYKPNIIVGNLSLMFKLNKYMKLKINTVIVDECSNISIYSLFESLLPFGNVQKYLLFGDSAQLAEHSGEKSLQTLLPNSIEVLRTKNIRITHRTTHRLQAPVVEFINYHFYSNFEEKTILRTIAPPPLRISDTIVKIASSFITFHCISPKQHVGAIKNEENREEANEICDFVGRQILNGIQPADIMIVTFYKKQQFMISKMLMERKLNISVRTVRQAIGTTSKLVVVSLTRKFAGQGDLVENPRAILTAMSRSEGHTVVFGDGCYIRNSGIWNSMKEFTGTW